MNYKVYESDGLDDHRIEQQQRYSNSYPASWTANLPPRVRNCFYSISMGARMGAAVGGTFGFLVGVYQSWAQRNVLLLISESFFLHDLDFI